MTCGLDGQVQSSFPATIGGSILSAPLSVTGTIAPLYAVNALDGSSARWNLAIPSLDAAQTVTFATSASACAVAGQSCASYSFKLPAQKPNVLRGGSQTQAAGAPVYSVTAELNPSSTCTQSSRTVYLQQDGTTPLSAVAGQTLVAQPIGFTGCH